MDTAEGRRVPALSPASVPWDSGLPVQPESMRTPF
jgi:hypothetical protein